MEEVQIGKFMHEVREEYTIDREGVVRRKGKIIEPKISDKKSGKLVVNMACYGGKYTKATVLRLLALAFLGMDPSDGNHVKPKDGNWSNLSLDNIQVGATNPANLKAKDKIVKSLLKGMKPKHVAKWTNTSYPYVHKVYKDYQEAIDTYVMEQKDKLTNMLDRGIEVRQAAELLDMSVLWALEVEKEHKQDSGS